MRTKRCPVRNYNVLRFSRLPCAVCEKLGKSWRIRVGRIGGATWKGGIAS
jgi:hypothetical protein